jgi:hypothetical protein
MEAPDPLVPAWQVVADSSDHGNRPISRLSFTKTKTAKGRNPEPA